MTVGSFSVPMVVDTIAAVDMLEAEILLFLFPAKEMLFVVMMMMT